MFTIEDSVVGEVTIVTSEVSTRIHWKSQDSEIFSRPNEFAISPSFRFGKRSLRFLMVIINLKLRQLSKCIFSVLNDKGKTFPISYRKGGNNFNPKVELETNGRVLSLNESAKNHSFSSEYFHIPLSTNPSTISLELFNTPESKKRLLELCDHKERARKRFCDVSQNLKESYLNKLHCDLTIKVKDRDFQVHKFMLILRSPVFAAMMEHNMAERKNNYINVTDCDPQAFDKFLIYMYSGETENLSLENVRDLYVVADKYAVFELKENCAEFMKHNLTVDVFCDVVELAEKHSDSGLLNVSRQFFNMNAKKILKTKRWKSLCQRNATLSSNILTSAENEKLSVFQKIKNPYNLRSHAAKTSSL